MRRALAIVGAAVLASGCGSAATSYNPRLVARGELTLRYDDGLEIWAGRKRFAEAPGFVDLAHHVRCVDRARAHADAAESDGTAAIGTGWAGSIIGVSGLGGLAGLAFLEDDKPLAFGLLGTGVAVGLVGMTLALISRSLKNSANGHAVDAVNYYNDEVGFWGGSCDAKRPEPRVVIPAGPRRVPKERRTVPAPATPPPAETGPTPESPAPALDDAAGAPDPEPVENAVPEEAPDRERDLDSVLEN